MAEVKTSDAMIMRLEKELEEKNSFLEGLISGAQDQDRDLLDNEKELAVHARSRITAIDDQLKLLHDSRETMTRARTRTAEVYAAMEKARNQVDNGPIEYRSTGAYVVDYIAAQTGSQAAKERLELYTRAAAHQKTSDNLGVVPDPIIGDVVNFIDQARPAALRTNVTALPGLLASRVREHVAVAP